MALFLSTYVNKIDKKGRVSVPARFRSVLSDKGLGSVIVFPSLNGDAIEACGMDVMETLLEKIGGFDPLSEDRDSFADTFMADSVELPIDGDGRIMLPRDMLDEVGIGSSCAFVGRGDSFQIWDPEKFTERRKSARSRMRTVKQARALGGGSEDIGA